LVHAPRSLPCETGLADAPGWYGGSGIAGTDAEPRGAGVADGGVRMTVGGVALWVSTMNNVKGEPGMLALRRRRRPCGGERPLPQGGAPPRTCPLLHTSPRYFFRLIMAGAAPVYTQTLGVVWSSTRQ
jgi:hypothetical protein